MALNNQTLGMQLGQRTSWGQGVNDFDTKSDLWKQQIDPWVNYYQQSSTPTEAVGLFNRIANNAVPTMPGDANSLAAQFGKAYAASQAPEVDESRTLISALGGKLPAQTLNDQYLKWYNSTLPPELQGVLNSPVASKTWGKDQGLSHADLVGYTDKLKNELSGLVGSGYNVKTASGSTQEQIGRLAPDLARYGVSSLSDLAASRVRSPYTGKDIDVFYNTRTGTIVPTNFGSSMKGEGGSNYKLYNYNGKVLPIANWKDTSEAADLAPLAMMVAMFAPAALGALGATGAAASGLASSTGISTGLATGLTNAGVSGLTQGALTAAMGGNFGQGFLGGALGSGIASGVGSLGIGSNVANSLTPMGNTANQAALNAALSQGVDSALAKGLTGGLTAGIMGGNAGRGTLAGLLSGGVSGAASGYLSNNLGSGLAGGVGSLASKYLTSSLLDPSSNPSLQGTLQLPPPTTSSVSTNDSLGPLTALKQLQQRVQTSGLNPSQQQRILSGLSNLAQTGQQKFGWS